MLDCPVVREYEGWARLRELHEAARRRRLLAGLARRDAPVLRDDARGHAIRTEARTLTLARR
jgi:hypothetical protein